MVGIPGHAGIRAPGEHVVPEVGLVMVVVGVTQYLAAIGLEPGHFQQAVFELEKRGVTEFPAAGQQ